MLDTKLIKNQILKHLCFSLFIFIFSIVYEIFSHNVLSYFMILSFLIPLISGAVYYIVIYLTKAYRRISVFSSKLYNSAVLTLTIGSVIKGFLEIYGTTNSLIWVYPIVAAILVITSIIANIISAKQ